MLDRAMPTIHQQVEVAFHYPVCFTTGLFEPTNPLLESVVRGGGRPGTASKLLFVVDRGVTDHHSELLASIETYCGTYREALALVAAPLIVDGGEPVKNDPANVSAIHRAINEHGIDRHSYVVAVGGGAVLDMVGYAAATAHRSVRLIRIPTTVLSQNDSAVGVKNSVNAFGKKNFLGTFTPPYAVLNDFDFLTTLSDRDWRSGISEAIKVALLKDPDFFAFIEANAGRLAERDMTAMRWLVYRCAQLHLEHIATSGDPFELGSSRPLDFGHWAAHKLEQLSNYALRHGEAVAIGLALDSTYAYLTGMLPEDDWRRILNAISAAGLPLYARELTNFLDQPHDPRCVLSGLNEFREHLGGELTVMLLRGVGQGIEVHEIDEATVIESIGLLRERRDTTWQERSNADHRRVNPAESAAAD